MGRYAPRRRRHGAPYTQDVSVELNTSFPTPPSCSVKRRLQDTTDALADRTTVYGSPIAAFKNCTVAMAYVGDRGGGGVKRVLPLECLGVTSITAYNIERPAMNTTLGGRGAHVTCSRAHIVYYFSEVYLFLDPMPSTTIPSRPPFSSFWPTALRNGSLRKPL